MEYKKIRVPGTGTSFPLRTSEHKNVFNLSEEDINKTFGDEEFKEPLDDDYYYLKGQ